MDGLICAALSSWSFLSISRAFFLSPPVMKVSMDREDGKCILLSCLIGNWIQMEE